MQWRFRPLLMVLLSLAISVRCEAQPADRLRPASSFEAGLIEEGLCRSATLKSLVATLNASDLIVYVNVRRLSSRGLAGGLQFVSATATTRILRVVIGLTVDRAARIALLGHELQHAVEVAGAPHLRSAEAFDDFYRAHGLPGATQHAYETEAARSTAERIRNESAHSLTACGVVKPSASDRERDLQLADGVLVDLIERRIFVAGGVAAVVGPFDRAGLLGTGE